MELTMRAIDSEFYEPSPLLRELQVLSILSRNPEASQKEIALEIERVAKDGVKNLGVLAGRDLAGTLSLIAAESGVEARTLQHGARAESTSDSFPLAGLDAVLIALDPAHEDVLAALRCCREQGLPVYRV